MEQTLNENMILALRDLTISICNANLDFGRFTACVNSERRNKKDVQMIYRSLNDAQNRIYELKKALSNEA